MTVKNASDYIRLHLDWTTLLEKTQLGRCRTTIRYVCTCAWCTKVFKIVALHPSHLWDGSNSEGVNYSDDSGIVYQQIDANKKKSEWNISIRNRRHMTVEYRCRDSRPVVVDIDSSLVGSCRKIWYCAVCGRDSYNLHMCVYIGARYLLEFRNDIKKALCRLSLMCIWLSLIASLESLHGGTRLGTTTESREGNLLADQLLRKIKHGAHHYGACV